MPHLRQSVLRSELAGWAKYGYCAYLPTTAEGMPITSCLAGPKAPQAPALGAARPMSGPDRCGLRSGGMSSVRSRHAEGSASGPVG